MVSVYGHMDTEKKKTLKKEKKGFWNEKAIILLEIRMPFFTVTLG